MVKTSAGLVLKESFKNKPGKEYNFLGPVTGASILRIKSSVLSSPAAAVPAPSFFFNKILMPFEYKSAFVHS